jgi:hypothetical protein
VPLNARAAIQIEEIRQMKLDETLARAGFLPLGGSGATLPAPQVGRSVDGATASLYRGLMKFWVRLYAPAPRRLSPLV